MAGKNNHRDDDILVEAKDRYSRCIAAEQTERKKATDCLKARAGDQWNEKEKNERQNGNPPRPAITINKLDAPVDQFVNAARQSRPGPKVSPVDAGASEVTADVIEGMLRHYEYISFADNAYDRAVDYAAASGFGWIGLLNEYAADDSFEMDLRIREFHDNMAVYLDPNSTKPDGSDAQYGFVSTWMDLDEFRERWPDAEPVSSALFMGATGTSQGWIDQHRILILEYWRIEKERRTLLRVRDPNTGQPVNVFQDELGKTVPKDVSVDDQREVEQRTVYQYLLNGRQVLERNDWPGKWIPLVPVYGKQYYVEGKKRLFGLIHHALEPQQILNFAETRKAELLATSPISPYVGPKGTFAANEGQWREANRKPFAYLEYDQQYGEAGQPLPGPARQSVEPPIQSLTIASQAADLQIKATTQTFDPSLGNITPDQSGIAIRQLQMQGQNAHFHITDNLRRALNHLYRMMVEIIQEAMTERRVVPVIAPDGSQRMVMINQPHIDPSSGQPVHHDLSKGRYNVVVNAGPSYQTRRQEVSDFLVQMARAFPQYVLPRAGDLLFKYSDGGPIVDQIGDRFVPPDIAAKQGNNQQQQQMQTQQLMQQNQMLVQALQRYQQDRDADVLANRSKEKIAALNAWTELQKTAMQQRTKLNETLVDTELQRLEFAHDVTSQQLDQMHQVAMQQMSDQQQQQPQVPQAPQAPQNGAGTAMPAGATPPPPPQMGGPPQ